MSSDRTPGRDFVRGRYAAAGVAAGLGVAGPAWAAPGARASGSGIPHFALTELVPSHDPNVFSFGDSIAVSGNTVAAAAEDATIHGLQFAGEVFIFTLP